MEKRDFSSQIAVSLTVFVLFVSPCAGADRRHGPDLSEMPTAAQARISDALGLDNPSYYAVAQGTSLNASNIDQKLAIHFSSQGIEVCSSSVRWGIAMRRYGYGDNLKVVAATPPQASRNRVEYRRGSVLEWYVNGPMGLEQGVTIAQPPGQAHGQPLTLVFALFGNLKASVNADGTGLALRNGEGTRLRYAGLAARDVHGRNLRAWLEVRNDQMLLRVDDANARYPLVVDPIIELAELTASDGQANDFFGVSVSISGDTVVVGAPNASVGSNSQQGAAYIFVKPKGGWMTTSTFTAKLTASDGRAGDSFGGGAVAITGKTVVVAACSQSAVCNNGPGKVYVFLKPAGGWVTTSAFAAKLTASDGRAADGFGISLAYGANTVVVGAPQSTGTSNVGRGKVYVFVKPASGWVTTSAFTAKLTASDGKRGDDFGFVSVSNDGGTVLVGAPLAIVGGNSQQGSAYIFLRSIAGWRTTSQFKAKLTASDGAAADQFGFCQSGSSCLSGDGKTVVAAAPQINVVTGEFTGPGKAYVFTEPTNGWTTTSKFAARLTASDGQVGDLLGWSVSVSPTGSTTVLGAVQATVGSNRGQGAVYVFVRPTSGWKTTSRFSSKLVASNGNQGENLGYSVSMSGNTVVSGAETAGPVPGQGAAYIFGK